MEPENATLEACLSPRNVQRAVQALAGDKAPWRYGVDHQMFAVDRDYYLLALIEDLRHERYRPEPVRQYRRFKADGGTRMITAMHLQDKLAQRLVAQVLTLSAERHFHPDSFGYRPGRSVAAAVGRARERVAAGLVWFVDADIKEFFDNVPHGPLRRVLRQYIGDRRILNLIDQWLTMGTLPHAVFKRRRGLLQGAVISPLLGNWYLNALDWRWAQRNIPFVRFADDFVLQLRSEREARAALADTARYLKRLGLELKPSKTRVAPASQPLNFLGKRIVNSRSLRQVAASYLSHSRK